MKKEKVELRPGLIYYNSFEELHCLLKYHDSIKQWVALDIYGVKVSLEEDCLNRKFDYGVYMVSKSYKIKDFKQVLEFRHDHMDIEYKKSVYNFLNELEEKINKEKAERFATAYGATKERLKVYLTAHQEELHKKEKEPNYLLISTII